VRRIGSRIIYVAILPAAAERFHQIDGGDELLTTQLHSAELDVQLGALRRRHIEVCGEAIAVTVMGATRFMTWF
jgi:hypothetical protein